MPGFYTFLPTPTYRSNRLARACSFPNPGLHTEDTSRWTKALLSSSLKRLLFRREISTRIRGLNRPRVSRGRSKLSKSRRPESVYVAGPQHPDDLRLPYHLHRHKPEATFWGYRLIPVSCPEITFLPGQLPPGDLCTLRYLSLTIEEE